MRHLTRTPEEKKALAAEVVDFLNDLHAKDPGVVWALIETRHPCNEAVDNHPTVQVTDQGVGMLGLLNGLVGIREGDGWGYITAHYDGETLLGFSVSKDQDPAV